jgi:aminopeptidase N
MKKGTPTTTYLKDYTPPPYLVDHVVLHFKLSEQLTEVHSKLTLRRNPASAETHHRLVLNGEQMELIAVKLDNKPLNPEQYHLDAESLTIDDVPERFQIEIVTGIRPAENTTLEGLYLSSGNFCTQCEAEGFRRITYFLDRPDVMATFTTTLQADKTKHPVLLSNGNLVDSSELGDNQHFARWHDPFPKPCYLFALVAGNLVSKEDYYETRSGRKSMLQIYVQAHNIDRCAHAMVSLKKAMRWDEETFGLEYDLSRYMIVAVDDFNMGAMENKGLNVFNSKYVLAKPDTATDEDYAGIEGVIAHEYFHNWTGNRVTCRDWFQLSLKEGLTVFRDQEFTADMNSRPVKRIHDVRLLRVHQFPEDSGPIAHPVRPQSYMEINNFYTATVYEKGAEVVRMYQTLLGREGFRKGMDLYFKRHDGQAVTTDDFAAAMADANQVDLTQFKRWYDQAGTPELVITGHWEESARSYILEVTQRCKPSPGQAVKAPFHIPLKLGLLASDGREIPLQLEGESASLSVSRVLEVRAERDCFKFLNVPEQPVVSLLREFSAPVNLHYEASQEELAFLMANDGDSFNRWEASQKYAIIMLKTLIECFQTSRELSIPEHFVRPFNDILTHPRLDKALIAEILTLPPETYLTELADVIDVEAIHAAREALRYSLAVNLESELLQAYQANTQSGAYTYNAMEAGRRRLKNRCLAYVTALDRPQYIALAMEQFRKTNNMTDSIGALGALIDCNCSEREEALSAFHNRWQHDTLVMDKWFALQAMSSARDTLHRVKQLTEHPLFSLRNPNKVRALIGSFARGNPINFHRLDGDGYGFVTDVVLRIDPLNPQVAAALIKVFSRWEKYAEPRRTLMQAQLKRVVETQRISRDVYEIASKSLI